MKSKIFIIEVEVGGEWKEFNGIEYAENAVPEMKELRYQLKNLRQHGYMARRRCIDTRDMVMLTCKPKNR